MAGYVYSKFPWTPIQAIEFLISIGETLLDGRLEQDFEEVRLRGK